MKASFINPAASPVSSSQATSINPSITPPLGILHLASVVESQGHQATVSDLDAQPMDWDGLSEFVSGADLIGLSLTTYSLRSGLEIAKYIEENHPETFVVAGGPHPTSAPEETLDCSAIDCVCIGEGERTIIELIQALENDFSLSLVDGIAYKDGNEIKYTASRDEIEDLDKIPFPAMEKVNLNNYSSSPHGPAGESAPIMSTRGCSFSCNYCVSEETMGRAVRFRSPEDIISEIEYLRRECGVSNIMFWDDTLTLSKQWFLDIGEALTNIDVTYTCFTRVDTFDEDIARVMKEGGCQMIFFGIESSDNDILDKLDKGITRCEISDAFELCHQYNIPKTASFMITPWDDDETIEGDIEFVKQILPEYLYVSVLNPLPESRILELAQDQGKFDESINWKQHKSQQAPMNRPVFSFEQLSRGDMNKLQEKFYTEYYSSRVYKEYITDALEEPELSNHLLRIRDYISDFEGKYNNIVEVQA